MANLKSTVPTSSVDELEADDALVSSAISQYSSLAVNPPLGKYTVLSSIALSRPDAHQVVSIGSGCKCLPTGRLPPRGDALHDSHAEVLSRRGAIRWFAEEAARFHATGRSQWIARRFEGKFALRKDMRLVMYISTIPCETLANRFMPLHALRMLRVEAVMHPRVCLLRSRTKPWPR